MIVLRMRVSCRLLGALIQAYHSVTLLLEHSTTARILNRAAEVERLRLLVQMQSDHFHGLGAVENFAREEPLDDDARCAKDEPTREGYSQHDAAKDEDPHHHQANTGWLGFRIPTNHRDIRNLLQ